MILIIRERATEQQLQDMMEILETYIKLAVDVERGILAGGGAMHADCEAVLLEAGSQQEFICGLESECTGGDFRVTDQYSSAPEQSLA